MAHVNASLYFPASTIKFLKCCLHPLRFSFGDPSLPAVLSGSEADESFAVSTWLDGSSKEPNITYGQLRENRDNRRRVADAENVILHKQP